MNSAANNIEAKSKTLKDLLKERKYQVKYFQREFKWQKNHIEDLIIDLERSFFSNFKVEHTREDVPDYDCYYMGPIVLYREKSAYIIVDGQQRLTSFTLLLIFLTHLQKDVFNDNQKKIQKLDEYIYSQPYEKETFNLEIKQREAILNCLYKDLEINDSDIDNESSHNILDRYNDIVDLFPITLKHPNVLPLFINWLVEKLIFIEIMAHSNESAYTIFETMNDRGLNLTQSEMLKSYLLSNVQDEVKIKELDISWKQKIGQLKKYGNEEDQDFFKAWLKAKYAITIRTTERGAANEDFEKISTRFSNWVQDNNKRLLHLDLHNPESFYYFVQSDFHFFSDIYIHLCEFKNSDFIPEHIFKLISYKGISPSLCYPFILAPIQKIDEETIINEKINLSVLFLDSYAVFRLLLNEPITHSSIRNAIYLKIKDIRDLNISVINEKLKLEIEEYKNKFLNTVDYLEYNPTYAKYVLSRIYKKTYREIPFENIYFQRRKDSFVLFNFFTFSDVEHEVHNIPKGLKDIIIKSLSAYCIIPKDKYTDAEKLPLTKRIYFLIKNGFIPEFNDPKDYDSNDLKEFFITRNKRMKEKIINIWKI
jgi:uncharacterized protein with ParB-like and HNH nuclease domain